LVSVIPILLSKEKREVRNNFCIKLSGLPFNTFALDLRNLLIDIHAKYCFIPRNPNNNNPLKHAYVYFENEEECIIASEKDNLMFKNNPLFWTDPEEKTCNRCGSASHLAASCDHAANTRPKYMNRTQKLKEFAKNSYQRKGNKNKSYADVIKTGQQHLRRGTIRTFVLGIIYHVIKGKEILIIIPTLSEK
jgi:RNA recognition motif-containing protein